MRTRNYFSVIAMAAAVMTVLGGCTKELKNDMAPVAEGETVVAAGLPSTRTYMDAADETGARKVYWENGDAININGTSSEALADVEEGTASVNFTFPAVLSYPYNAIYPASAYKNASTITLASLQGYERGTFAQNTLPMAAYATGEGVLSFSHLCSVVKLSLTLGEDADEIKHIEFRGNNGEQVSGDFTVNFETLAIAPASTAEADKTVRANVRKSLSAEGATEVYVVVPAGEYANGFTVKVVDVKGHYMEKARTAAATLTAGKVFVMPELVFAPTGTEVDVEIASAQDLVDFSKAYNAGDYDEVTPVLVAITGNIAFDETTLTAYEPMGSEEKPFSATIMGNNKTVSGYVAAKPLINYADYTFVQDLTFDNTCAVNAVVAEEDPMPMTGVLAGYYSGNISNCHSAAALSVTGTATEGGQFGGLIGNFNAGVIDNCSVSGTVSLPGTLTSLSDVNVGGVVGYANDEATIKNTKFKGHLDYQALMTVTNKRLGMGGIVGYTRGVVDGCETVADGENEVISAASTATHTSAIGGIAGIARATSTYVKNSVNNGVMHIFFLRTGDACREEHIGGVVGSLYGNVVDCVNTAKVTSQSELKEKYLGGVVGMAREGSNISGCSNSGWISSPSAGTGSQGARYAFIGGVAGSVAGSVSDIQNTGNLTCDRLEKSKIVTICLGGCIGDLTTELDGTADYKITNSGSTVSTAGAVATLYFKYAINFANIGGVVGRASAPVKYVKNSGTFLMHVRQDATDLSIGGVVGNTTAAIDHVENSGEITCQVDKNEAEGGGVTGSVAVGGVVGASTGDVTYAKNTNTVTFEASYLMVNGCIGGVVGLSSANSVNIANCENSGHVTRTGGNVKNSKNALGGIIGLVNKTASTVKDCANTGFVDMVAQNNATTFNAMETKSSLCGGVIGSAIGADAENVVKIQNCTSDGFMYSKRGFTGGIVCYAKYAQIEGCTSTMDSSRSANGGKKNNIAGHNAGIAVNIVLTKIDNCSCTANLYGTSTSTTNPGLGGIVSNMDGASSITNSKADVVLECTADGAVFGGIAAYTAAGATISDCKFKGTVNSNALTADNVCGDSNATCTNNTLLD